MVTRVPEGDRPDEPLSTRVVRAVAAYENARPNELPPLHRTVDADALDRLFVQPTEGEGRSDVSVTFPYAGHQVTVFADGKVGIATSEALEDRSS